MHYALCAFVEYPASALLSEEQEHGVKERGGGEEDGGERGGEEDEGERGEEDEGERGEEDKGGEEGRQYLSYSDYYNVTLSSYQVFI
jgi:hypothetical protein